MDLKKLESLNALVQQWEYLPEASKLETIRQLQNIGTLGTINVTDQELYLCPMHQFKLSQPCGLTECPYYVESKEDSNCLYHSLDRSKKGRMTINETSTYMKMPITEINKVSNDAFLKIRREYLRERILEAGPIDFRYIKGHCVNCEEYIQNDLDLNSEPSLTIEYAKYGWCSLECKEAKPKWKFYLEHLYNTHYLEVVKHAFLLVVTYATRSPEREVDTLLDLPNGTASSLKKHLRSIM